jgi:hypothetical protein
MLDLIPRCSGKGDTIDETQSGKRKITVFFMSARLACLHWVFRTGTSDQLMMSPMKLHPFQKVSEAHRCWIEWLMAMERA